MRWEGRGAGGGCARRGRGRCEDVLWREGLSRVGSRPAELGQVKVAEQPSRCVLRMVLKKQSGTAVLGLKRSGAGVVGAAGHAGAGWAARQPVRHVVGLVSAGALGVLVLRYLAPCQVGVEADVP